MEITLNSVEQRVLGALMEKALTTPEYYPLSLNSLTIACNQKTSRDPVTEYTESEVLQAVDSLRAQGLGMRLDLSGSRTPKYKHEADDTFTLDAAERALICVLLLRGPQTVGQLRQRSERLHIFATSPKFKQHWPACKTAPTNRAAW
ncbi:MAG: YceH family protein [Verrucomicrobia bacterium]|nr:YceH family protein [Verrucomicrobiota bacterium]